MNYHVWELLNKLFKDHICHSQMSIKFDNIEFCAWEVGDIHKKYIYSYLAFGESQPS